MVSGIEVITIGEGVIVYQCEEGLVPEGRVEAICDDDGRWSPDLTQHMCNDYMNSTTDDTSTSTTNTTTQQDTCIACLTTSSANIIGVIVGSSVSSAVVLVVVLLVIVLLIWKVSKKCT